MHGVGHLGLAVECSDVLWSTLRNRGHLSINKSLLPLLLPPKSSEPSLLHAFHPKHPGRVSLTVRMRRFFADHVNSYLSDLVFSLIENL